MGYGLFKRGGHVAMPAIFRIKRAAYLYLAGLTVPMVQGAIANDGIGFTAQPYRPYYFAKRYNAAGEL
jgi:hypothetical protein